MDIGEVDRVEAEKSDDAVITDQARDGASRSIASVQIGFGKKRVSELIDHQAARVVVFGPEKSKILVRIAKTVTLKELTCISSIAGVDGSRVGRRIEREYLVLGYARE